MNKYCFMPSQTVITNLWQQSLITAFVTMDTFMMISVIFIYTTKPNYYISSADIKKNQRICDLLSKTLLNKYPDYYNRVVELFANNHKRMQNKAKNTTFPDLSVQMCIASYQDYLHSLSKNGKSYLIPICMIGRNAHLPISCF